MKLILILLIVSTCAAMDSEILQQLPDGIQVQQGIEMAIEEGVCTLLLTISEPGEDFRAEERATLIHHVNTLWHHISWQPFNSIFTVQRKTLMRARLDLIRQDHSIHFNFNRGKKIKT